MSWLVGVVGGAGLVAWVDGLGGCGSCGLVGGCEGLLAERGLWWWQLCGTCWGWAGVGVIWRVWLGAEAVKGGLVAGGWSWLVGFASVAFGVGSWE